MLRRIAKQLVLGVLHARETRGATPRALSSSLWDLVIGPNGWLWWDGCDLAEIVDRFGTPLHIVSLTRLERDYTGFFNAFATRYPKVEVGYSYKTNPLPAVLAELHHLGASAEVISHFELWLALKLGVAPERIIFNGPGKTPAALELAVHKGIKLINVDHFEEIELLDRYTQGGERKQRVGVRVVTSVGWSGQFGLRLRDGAAMEAFRRLKRARNLVPCSIHVHLGSGIRQTAPYRKAAEEVLGFIRVLKSELDIEINYLDMGGGFGVPTVRSLSEMDTRFLLNGFPVKPPAAGEAPRPGDYAEAIIPVIRRHLGSDPERLPELIVEPGRAVTSSAQLLLLKVIATKAGDRHGPFVIVDGGKNIAMPPGYEYHELLSVNRPAQQDTLSASVFGPLCHPGDVICLHRRLPRLQINDTLALMDAGAYFIPNQMNFSNPRPAAVMLRNGAATLIRVSESFEDVVRLDRPADSGTKPDILKVAGTAA